MDDQAPKRSQRAMAGHAELKRGDFARPDTLVVLKTGGGEKIISLGRPSATEPRLNPAFHMFNPSRRGGRKVGKNSKPPQPPRILSAAAAAAAARDGSPGAGVLQGPLALLDRVPFMNLLITAALAHRVGSFVVRRFFGGGGGTGGAATQQVVRHDGAAAAEDDEDEEEELDERAEDLLHKMQHASMLPTMLRASLPPPRRKNLAKRAAEQHRSRHRDYRTSHQMMHGGPAAAGVGAAAAAAAGGPPGKRQAQRRPLGKLEKLDLLVRQQVRAAMLAQQRQQADQLMQHQLALEAPPGGAPLALPAAPSAPSSTGLNNSQREVPRQHQGSSQAHPGNQLVLTGSTGVPQPHSPGLLPPAPLPPPAFRPLPPDLLARVQGAPRPSAVASSPAARAAAAGPPPAPQAADMGVDAGRAHTAGGVGVASRAQEQAATEVSASGASGKAVQGKVEEEEEEAMTVSRVVRLARGKRR